MSSWLRFPTLMEKSESDRCRESAIIPDHGIGYIRHAAHGPAGWTSRWAVSSMNRTGFGKIQLIALLAALLLSGCGTLLDMAYPNDLDGLPETHGPHVYGGVRFDLEALGIEDPYGIPRWLITILCVIDLPLSFAFDTVMLIVSIPNTMFPPDPAEEPSGVKKAP